jgi:hypothetical protein
MADPPVDLGGKTVSRGETALFALLCAGLIGYWALQYQPFVLPNNDFPSFERTAESLAALELPQSYQRMPIFPALLGVVAPLLPSRHPYLDAALLANAAFSLGLLAAVFALSARAIGRGALLVPALLASTTQFHSMGLQPLVEPSLGFFVALSFLLLQRRSPWQWAAAWGAALSRYEAVALIPVLFATNVWREGRLARQAGLAALASSGFVGWALLGAAHGSGGATYLDLMQGMDFRPATDFLARSLKEPFRGWWREDARGVAVFLAVTIVPFAAGVRAGLRELRGEALALLAFFAACAATIVAFGINKARYVYPTEWIPLFFFALGAIRLAGSGAARLSRLPAPLAGAAAIAAAGALLFLARRFALRIAATAGAQPAWLDVAFAALCVALIALALAPLALDGARAEAASPRRRAAALASTLALLAVAAPLVGGGIHAKRKEMYKVYYANYGSYVAADWLARNLRPEERAVVVSPSHVLFLTELDPDQLVGYASLPAASVEELRAEMRARGIRYALYTWRKPLDTPSDAYYHEKLKAFLGEAFRSGGAVAGFEHVATLALPPELGRDPVQVYRLDEGKD